MILLAIRFFISRISLYMSNDFRIIEIQILAGILKSLLGIIFTAIMKGIFYFRSMSQISNEFFALNIAKVIHYSGFDLNR